MKSYGVTIQMKATEQYFPVVLFVMLYKVVLLSLWMKSYGVTIQMKATEQYFPLVLFIMLFKEVLTLSLWIKFYDVKDLRESSSRVTLSFQEALKH